MTRSLLDGDHDGQPGSRSGSPIEPAPHGFPHGSDCDDVQWHLAEVAAALRHEPKPLRPELLRIVLRGLGDLCRFLHERGDETPAQPPSLFRDHPIVAEALAMWDGRVRVASTDRHPRSAAESGNDSGNESGNGSS